MIDHIKPENVLFLDIETAPQYPDYESLPDIWKELWNVKSKFLQQKNEKTAEEIYHNAGIFAEFGKILCISCGIIFNKSGVNYLRIKTFCHLDESHILLDFVNLLNTFYHTDSSYLCAHNGREFDFPYIARRCVVHNIALPRLLNISGKRNWETKNLLDTLEMWKFGDQKHYISLELLSSVFGFGSPKSEMSGDEVAQTYWKEQNLEKIVHYCNRDVEAIAQIFLKYKREYPLLPENIETK